MPQPSCSLGLLLSSQVDACPACSWAGVRCHLPCTLRPSLRAGVHAETHGTPTRVLWPLVKPIAWLLSQSMFNYSVELVTTGSSQGQELSKTLERDRPFKQTIRISRVVIIHADKNFGKDVQLFALEFKPSRKDQETWSERRGVGGQITSPSGYGRGPTPPQIM